METDFIYWRHMTPVGIKVEEVCGAEDRSGRVWRELAMQVYLENGHDGYREVEHTESGAPWLENEPVRISITHTKGLLAVASLPKTPEAGLPAFSERTAMGIDAERTDREQVLKIRERFLSESELSLVGKDDLKANIVAWTAKEALYKAALDTSIDWRADLRIERLPELLSYEGNTPKYKEGHAVMRREGTDYGMNLFAYESEGCIVMLAYSPKIAKFPRRR